ncbi:MAG: hypothetical protein DRH56_10810 [Deltaproteobacteria bacterium]|nr:MAG: hypothetical protein DRH56_10810 [Deltaproteobacteria bacterium]
MKCDRCHDEIPEGEEMERFGQTLCEDCYMDLLSPARTCDPWAVHSARTLAKDGAAVQMNPLQQRLLETLEEKGPTEPGELARMLGIKETDLERELAALRHMEKIRAELKDGRKRIRLWENDSS